MKIQTIYISDDGFAFETVEEHDKYLKLLSTQKLICRKKSMEDSICVYWLEDETNASKEIWFKTVEHYYNVLSIVNCSTIYKITVKDEKENYNLKIYYKDKINEFVSGDIDHYIDVPGGFYPYWNSVLRTHKIGKTIYSRQCEKSFIKNIIKVLLEEKGFYEEA